MPSQSHHQHFEGDHEQDGIEIVKDREKVRSIQRKYMA
ncbi:MAG: hypothetical protein ETSY1_25295 [Candidatus Entotheonella factor]|uniref:Uncharacterized protein n=1 Tax=Entotheonella factor TaxID=1429438 RepID=W4LFB9_ENTF1|nr:MAG: hypothetical protein ETSY1_25295 [Candidatus Entotheonella factor]